MKHDTEYTDEKNKNLNEEELITLINSTLKQITDVFSSATKHISQLEEYKKKIPTEDNIGQEVDEILSYAKPKIQKSLLDVQDAVNDIYNIDAKILTPSNQSLKMGKAYVETMSQEANRYIESLQGTRDERYEKMIEEAEEKYGSIESPMDRLKR